MFNALFRPIGIPSDCSLSFRMQPLNIISINDYLISIRDTHILRLNGSNTYLTLSIL